MRPPLPALVLSALLTLGLSSCSGDPVPIVEPTPTITVSSPQPPPEATPTPSPTPEAESAKAFIRRWQAVSFDMQNSGDPTDYLAMTENCSSCGSLADGVSQIYARGGSVDGAGGRVSQVARVGQVEDVAIFEFLLTTRPSAILEADGSVKTDLTGGVGRYQINMTRDSGGWKVSRISRIDS